MSAELVQMETPEGEPPHTDFEERFVREYILDCCGTQAYLRVKPNVKTESARVSASRLLSKANVQAAIAVLQAEQ